MRKNSYTQEKAIVLYETIIAAIVITLCITVALRTFTTSLNSAKITEYYLQANELLKTKYADYFLSSAIDTGNYEGIFDQPYEHFSWEAIIEEESSSSLSEPIDETAQDIEEESSSGFYRIILTVSWIFKRRTHKISLLSYLKKQDKETAQETASSSQSYEALMESLRKRRAAQDTVIIPHKGAGSETQ